jgi:tungstate transport system ATP-binding protein
LAVRDLLFQKDRKTIVQIDALEILPGEVTAVLGPNGAGKSTLVQLLAMLVEPTSGAILHDGCATEGDRLGFRRRMASVFQEPLLLDTSVRSNAESGLALRGIPRAVRRERAEFWMERFGVGHLSRRSARTLSGGEAQRVSLARAFAVEPEVLFLDEPFAALDAPTRIALTEELQPLLTDQGRATVFVTHDRSEALRLGDRVVVMMDGRVRQAGTPGEVFGAPDDEEVAQFVGVETIANGRVTGLEMGVAVVDVGGRTVAGGSGVDVGDEVLFCLRPEDVIVEPGRVVSGETSARNHLPASVTRVVPWGPFLRLELDAGFKLVALITRQALDDLGLSPGSDVTATFKAAAVHLIKRHAQVG